ncbi:MAG: hypothetical protein ACRDRN_19655, partial [Sciscionella sp.]
MPIDVSTALGAEPSTREASWTRRDVLLYHLSLGAARDAADPELGYTYERDLRVLPTFAMVAGQGLSAGDGPALAMSMPGIDIDLRKVLHAGRSQRWQAPEREADLVLDTPTTPDQALRYRLNGDLNPLHADPE